MLTGLPTSPPLFPVRQRHARCPDPPPAGRMDSQGRMDRHQQWLTALVKNWLMRSVGGLERHSRASTPNKPDSPQAAPGSSPLDEPKLPNSQRQTNPTVREKRLLWTETEETSFPLAMPDDPESPCAAPRPVPDCGCKFATRETKRTREPARSVCFASRAREAQALRPATPNEPETRRGLPCFVPGPESTSFGHAAPNEPESPRKPLTLQLGCAGPGIRPIATTVDGPSVSKGSAIGSLEAGRHGHVLGLELEAGGQRHGLEQGGEVLAPGRLRGRACSAAAPKWAWSASRVAAVDRHRHAPARAPPPGRGRDPCAAARA